MSCKLSSYTIGVLTGSTIWIDFEDISDWVRDDNSESGRWVIKVTFYSINVINLMVELPQYDKKRVLEICEELKQNG